MFTTLKTAVNAAGDKQGCDDVFLSRINTVTTSGCRSLTIAILQVFHFIAICI